MAHAFSSDYKIYDLLLLALFWKYTLDTNLRICLFICLDFTKQVLKQSQQTNHSWAWEPGTLSLRLRASIVVVSEQVLSLACNQWTGNYPIHKAGYCSHPNLVPQISEVPGKLLVPFPGWKLETLVLLSVKELAAEENVRAKQLPVNRRGHKRKERERENFLLKYCIYVPLPATHILTERVAFIRVAFLHHSR